LYIKDLKREEVGLAVVSGAASWNYNVVFR